MSLEQLVEIRRKENELRSAWTRQILTLAAGGFAILSGLGPPVPAGIGKYFLAAAWVFLGSGIIAGGAATYLEVKREADMGDIFQERLRQSIQETGRPIVNGLVVAQPRKLFLWARKLMPVSLLLAVACLVVYSVMVTLGG